MANKSYMILIISFVFLIALSTDVSPKSQIGQRKKQAKRIEATIAKDLSEFQPVFTEKSTLKDYLKIGLSRNLGLKAAFYKWKASLENISKEFSLPDPQFTYTNYIDEVETRVGPQERAFSIKQKFPMFDKLWVKKSKAFKASESDYYEFEKKQLELIFQITDTYYEYLYLHKAILLTEENMRLLGNFESVAQKRYASGIQRNQDLLKVQVELGKLENELYSLQDLRWPVASRLNALLNYPEGNLLPWPSESLENITLEKDYIDITNLVSLLKKDNPQLQSLSEKVGKNEQALKLSKREFIPDLTVGYTQIDTSDALNLSAVDSGKDPRMVMFSVNVPLWFNRLRAGVQASKASLEASKNHLLDKESELISKLALVHYKMRDALRQSSLYKDALIPKATQTLNATKSGYEAGGVDFLSLIDAQRMLLNFQLAYYRYNANFYQRLSELKSLLGAVPIEINDEFLQ